MKNFIVPLFAIVLFLSCTKKDKTELNILADKTKILTTGVWRMTGYRYEDITTYVTFAGLPSCRQDDLRIFKDDGTFEINEGASKCNSTDPQSIFGQWKFLGDHATMIDLDGKEYSIIRLDSIQFQISSYNRSYTFNK